MQSSFRPDDRDALNASARSAHCATRPRSADPEGPVVIALVNNMPDSALLTTEQQFRELLGAAAGPDSTVELRLFSFPELIRGESARVHVAEHYESIDRLWDGGFDGLIVTGAEPRAAVLPDEVYWRSLSRLAEWADDGAPSTVWSCLAAHAAVLHLHGIERRRLPEKLSGVFSCSKAGDHSLLSGMPSSWRIPHSRYNTLDPAQLTAAGYDIVSWSDDAGADTFIQRRRTGALFVFYQGHPEYDAGALLREYRRDVGRFLAGVLDRYPEIPRGYFDAETAHAFARFRRRAHRERRPELLDGLPGRRASDRPAHTWNDAAIRLYTNWLRTIVVNRRHEATAGDSVLPALSP
jgi:homoserine O-succinyltransferase